ncbi:hypothetical protein ZWY2020_058220 [Hordeum vulgare]|nr:hypothetical protein ZWY2020_058220 [Hordeum vulgare]
MAPARPCTAVASLARCPRRPRSDARVHARPSCCPRARRLGRRSSAHRLSVGEAAGNRVLSRLHSIREHIGDSLFAHSNELVAVFTRLVNLGNGMLQSHQIIAEYNELPYRNI